MNLKIMNENIEFELFRSTKKEDILLGINVRDPALTGDLMTITICLARNEFDQLKELLEAD